MHLNQPRRLVDILNLSLIYHTIYDIWFAWEIRVIEFFFSVLNGPKMRWDNWTWLCKWILIKVRYRYLSIQWDCHAMHCQSKGTSARSLFNWFWWQVFHWMESITVIPFSTNLTVLKNHHTRALILMVVHVLDITKPSAAPLLLSFFFFKWREKRKKNKLKIAK